MGDGGDDGEDVGMSIWAYGDGEGVRVGELGDGGDDGEGVGVSMWE